MLCGSSAVRVAPEPHYDPVAEYAGTWFDEVLIQSTTAVKLLVTLEGGAQVPEVKAVIRDGGCGLACENVFGAAGSAAERRICLLLHASGSGAAHVDVTAVQSKQCLSFPLPQAADGTVRHALDEIGLAGVVVSLRHEAAESTIATKTDMAALGLQEHVLYLSGGSSGEPRRAFVTYRTAPENTRCLIWLPGRNDMFSHPHVVPLLDACGLDLYVIEHRRLGRSQLGASRDDFALTSHAVNFRDFLEEHDAGFAFALSQKAYANVVLYSHSTGGLETTLYCREGKYRDRIDAVVLNSPFLDWGMGGVAEMLCDAMDELMPIASFLKGKEAAAKTDMPGTGTKSPSAWGARIYSQYPAIDLRCRNFITNRTTAGFISAAASLHDELLAVKAPTAIPTLALHTDGDSILDGKEVSGIECTSTSLHLFPLTLPLQTSHDANYT